MGFQFDVTRFRTMKLFFFMNLALLVYIYNIDILMVVSVKLLVLSNLVDLFVRCSTQNTLCVDIN